MSLEMEEFHQLLKAEKDRATMWMRMYLDLANRFDDIADHIEVEIKRASTGVEAIRDEYPKKLWAVPKELDDSHS